MATNQNSGIGVFFDAKFNFRVQIPDFRQAHHYKITKNHFSGCQDQKFLFTGSSWRRLKRAERRQFCPRLLADHANGAWLESWPSKQHYFLCTDANAGLQNKQKKCNFPAIVKTKTTLLKPFLIGLTEIITPWRWPKIRRKKVQKFFKNLRALL